MNIYVASEGIIDNQFLSCFSLCMNDTPKTVISSLKLFLTGTLLSRFSGLLREVVMAFSFGISPTIASFWMAFRFANLFRRLFGEGGLNIAFIPHYESLKKKDSSEAGSFFIHLSQTLTYILLFLVLGVELILGSLLIWAPLSAETSEILRFTMILLPALLFLSLFALNSALLNSEKNFFLPSAAPTVVNILWIAAALLLPYLAPLRAIEYLAISIVFAFAVQWLITAIPAYSLASRYPMQKKYPLLPFLRPFLLTIIGVTAQQINGAVDALFAKAADPEGPALLWYALRLQQLPFALIGVGLMNSLLPPLSRATDETNFHNLLNFSLKKVSIFMIPLTAATIAGGFAAVNLLYGRGAFSEKATYETTICLMAYGLSLLPMAWTLLLAAAFYAKKHYKIPTLCSIGSILGNVLLNFLFVYIFHWKAVSIALSTTCASLCNVCFLAIFLYRQNNGFLNELGKNVLKITTASIGALITTIFVSSWLLGDNTLHFFLRQPLADFDRTFKMQLLSMGCITAIFGGTLFLLAYFLKIDEILKLIQAIKRRKRSV